MPIDPTTLPSPHHPARPVSAFAQSVGIGIAIPFVSIGFGGLGGGIGFLVAVAILAVTAIAVKPSLPRAAGIATGLGVAYLGVMAFLAYMFRDGF